MQTHPNPPFNAYDCCAILVNVEHRNSPFAQHLEHLPLVANRLVPLVALFAPAGVTDREKRILAHKAVRQQVQLPLFARDLGDVAVDGGVRVPTATSEGGPLLE